MLNYALTFLRIRRKILNFVINDQFHNTLKFKTPFCFDEATIVLVPQAPYSANLAKITHIKTSFEKLLPTEKF